MLHINQTCVNIVLFTKTGINLQYFEMVTSKGSYEDLVIIDYNDLLLNIDTQKPATSLSPYIEKAFGSFDESEKNRSSLGILAIKNVPGFVDAKQNLLPQAYQLAHLPHSYLENNLTDKESLYNSGWSHGKEKIGDTPDLAKGSFYYNPISDVPGSKKDRDTYPVSYPCSKCQII